jgi:RNA-binding protein
MARVTELSSRQRKFLRGLAHDLEPVVHAGKHGLTDELVRQVEHALDAHELIKLRFVAGKTEKSELVEALGARTGAAAAGVVGHVAILYRPQRDPAKRKIRLPG